MPVENCFVDSNVWLYAFVTDENEAQKTATATALIGQTTPVISTQVVNEVCVNLIRKADFTETQIRRLLASFYVKYRVVRLNRSIFEAASQLREQYSLSYWDSNIVAAALEAQVKVLYSEDMHNGLVVNKQLQIVNPFS